MVVHLRKKKEPVVSHSCVSPPSDWRGSVRFVTAGAAILCCLMAKAGPCSAADSRSPEPDPSGVADVVSLQDSDLRESSGLAVSNRRAGHFWSHNDSGSDAKLFAFDHTGRKTGHVKLKSTKADDWEDMAAYLDQGVPRLLVADSGDNDSKRSHIRLHLFDEPDPADKTSLEDREVESIKVRYDDGPRDCEAVAVDLSRDLIVLVTKSKYPLCGVYTLPLPRRDDGRGDFEAVAKRIQSLPIPMVTAMDIDPANGNLWIVSYFHTMCFPGVEPNLGLQRQLVALPETYELPRWKQIEAVAVDREGSLWVTSEGKHAPLGRLSPDALAGQRKR